MAIQVLGSRFAVGLPALARINEPPCDDLLHVFVSRASQSIPNLLVV